MEGLFLQKYTNFYHFYHHQFLQKITKKVINKFIKVIAFALNKSVSNILEDDALVNILSSLADAGIINDSEVQSLLIT